jgi:hypothetical protein
MIEYSGAVPVLGIGAVTGWPYRFAARGARVSVDVRDAPHLLARADMRRS